MPTQSEKIWSKGSTVVAYTFLVTSITLMCLGDPLKALGFLILSVSIMTYSVLRFTSVGQMLLTPKRTRNSAPRTVPGGTTPRTTTSTTPSPPLGTGTSILSKGMAFSRDHIPLIVIGGILLLSIVSLLIGHWKLAIILLVLAAGALIHHYKMWPAIWNWVRSTLSPFAQNNWRGVWLGVSCTGLIISVMMGYKTATVAGWTISTLLAGLTFFGFWQGIMGQAKKALFGGYGNGFGSISWSMLLSLFAGLLYFYANGHGYLSGVAGWMFCAALVAFWFGPALMIHKTMGGKKGG